MSDFSFMKSGFNIVKSNDEKNLQENINIMVATFMSEGVKHAAHYVDHHLTRNCITPEDIKRGMMLEVFLFNNRPDLLNRTDEIKKLIQEYADDEDEDTEDEDAEDEDAEDEYSEDAEDADGEKEKFSENNCQCAVCKCLNTIYDRWGKWTPQTPFEIIVKKNIDEIEIPEA